MNNLLTRQQKHEINNRLQGLMLDKRLEEVDFYTCIEVRFRVIYMYSEHIYTRLNNKYEQIVKEVANELGSGMSLVTPFGEGSALADINPRMLHAIRTEAIKRFSKYVGEL